MNAVTDTSLESTLNVLKKSYNFLCIKMLKIFKNDNWFWKFKLCSNVYRRLYDHLSGFESNIPWMKEGCIMQYVTVHRFCQRFSHSRFKGKHSSLPLPCSIGHNFVESVVLSNFLKKLLQDMLLLYEWYI